MRYVDRDTTWSELVFHSMGTDAHVIVVGGDEALADAARRRLFDIEQRWSRFVPSSEVNELTANAGSWAQVSPDTALLVANAVEAWRLTGGAFDPTVLGAVIRAGYDRTLDELDGRPGTSELVVGCTDIEIDLDRNRVRLPHGTGFDAGGIGKGLAADVVAEEVMLAGADGVCINLGGDLRAIGASPNGAWTVAIEHEWSSRPIALVGIAGGAVATSTTLRRTWTVDGDDRRRHHVIDPRTGEPSTTDLTLATVITGEAWLAEVLATAVLLRGSARAFDLIGRDDAALAVDDRGRVMTSLAFASYMGAAA